MENINNKFWLIMEPYVYANMARDRILLYNTLDGNRIESSQPIVAKLLRKLFRENNVGVIEINDIQLKESSVRYFVEELRDKYMGDLIEASLLDKKPVQMLPYINFPIWSREKCNFNFLENWLQALKEITIHVDSKTDILLLISYLKTIPDNVSIVIIDSLDNEFSRNSLFDFLNQNFKSNTLVRSYSNLFLLSKDYSCNFSYQVMIDFPVNKSRFKEGFDSLKSWSGIVNYIFNIRSDSEYFEAEELINTHNISTFQIVPVYTGSNLEFFKKNVFLTHDDIFSELISMKTLFRRRTLNENDFGKLQIFSNGDIYANPFFPVLGNISTHSILDIVRKEIKNGQSWLRVRNQGACYSCIYRDLCPSPSDYELSIGYPNLCHVES